MLKEKLRKKLKEAKGFTLVEMLVVVALIAIMVSISIPMLSNSTKIAKKNTNLANYRAAKSLVAASEVSGKLNGGGADFVIKPNLEYFYDAESGSLRPISELTKSVKGYNLQTNTTSTSGDVLIGNCSFSSNTYVIKILYDGSLSPNYFWVSVPTT